MYMSQLSIRIEEKTKREASKTLAALGLDLSSAVKMFLNQVIVEQAIPFKPSRSPKQVRADWDREAAYALKFGKRYDKAESIFKDILSDNK
jgi:DNA-damage-inducible protein J